MPDLQKIGWGTDVFELASVFGSESPVLTFPTANGVVLSPMLSVKNGKASVGSGTVPAQCYLS